MRTGSSTNDSFWGLAWISAAPSRARLAIVTFANFCHRPQSVLARRRLADRRRRLWEEQHAQDSCRCPRGGPSVPFHSHGADRRKHVSVRNEPQRRNSGAASSRDGSGNTDLGPADAVLHRSHHGARPERAERQQRHRAQPRCAADGAELRRHARQGQGPRTAARDPGAAQGQHRHRRQDADGRRVVRARRQAGAGRLDGRREASRGRRGDPREDQPFRMGELPLLLFDERLVRTRRAHR